MSPSSPSSSEGEGFQNEQFLHNMNRLVCSILEVRDVANYMLQNANVSSEQHLRDVVRAMQETNNMVRNDKDMLQFVQKTSFYNIAMYQLWLLRERIWRRLNNNDDAMLHVAKIGYKLENDGGVTPLQRHLEIWEQYCGALPTAEELVDFALERYLTRPSKASAQHQDERENVAENWEHKFRNKDAPLTLKDLKRFWRKVAKAEIAASKPRKKGKNKSNPKKRKIAECAFFEELPTEVKMQWVEMFVEGPALGEEVDRQLRKEEVELQTYLDRPSSSVVTGNSEHIKQSQPGPTVSVAKTERLAPPSKSRVIVAMALRNCMQRVASRLHLPFDLVTHGSGQVHHAGAFQLSRECLQTLTNSKECACLLTYTEGDWFARLVPLNSVTMHAIQKKQQDGVCLDDPHNKPIVVEWGSGADSGVLLVHFKKCKAVPSKRLPADTPAILKPQGKNIVPHPALGYLSLKHREAFCLHSNPVTSEVNFADTVACAKAACFFLLPMIVTHLSEMRLFYLFCKTKKIYLQSQKGYNRVDIHGEEGCEDIKNAVEIDTAGLKALSSRRECTVYEAAVTIFQGLEHGLVARPSADAWQWWGPPQVYTNYELSANIHLSETDQMIVDCLDRI